MQSAGYPVPVIMAPMFLVTNEPMLKAASDSGIMGVFPTLNYRKEGELGAIIKQLHDYKQSRNSSGNFGVNLIVQKSNPFYQQASRHLY